MNSTDIRIQEIKNIVRNEIREIIKEEITNAWKNSEIQIREIIKEEIKNIWNSSEIPTLTIIIEKLNSIIKDNKTIQEEILRSKIITQGETSTIQKEDKIETEMVPINAWKRGIEPMMMDISKMKPNLPKPVEQTLEKLRELKKQGKF